MTREWSVSESAELGDIIAVAIRAVIAGAANWQGERRIPHPYVERVGDNSSPIRQTA